MVSSIEGNGNIIDSTVGALVWVRRRNGSWWPGRILGNDELPDTCLVSKRSGTPVKLLGREDASVDWYNFERSKRVKPFRCGEFDDCIEKAKFISTIPGKRSPKYAHREGAILHALKLEKSQLLLSNNNKNYPETISTSDIATSSISISPNDSEEDGVEGSKKRMRGLEDLGIGRAVSSFKKRRSQVVHVHGCLKKKDRRRQLSKVLKRPDMFSIPVMCEKITKNGDSCKQKEKVISSENGDSAGRLFDVPFIRGEITTAGSSPGLVSENPQVNAGVQFGQSSHIETISMTRPEEIQESASISSKWQHKGKRNSRKKITKSIQKFPQRLMPCRLSRFAVNPKFRSSEFSYDKIETGSLYEVDIEVQVGHFPHHVPHMSLLSKLTGQPITGHKLVVEVLKDSVSDLLFSNRCELDGVNGDIKKVPEVSRKIRRLSSLTGSKKLDRTEDLACVPIKVVFSRLNAALGII